MHNMLTEQCVVDTLTPRIVRLGITRRRYLITEYTSRIV
jgi:hypothetical protein